MPRSMSFERRMLFPRIGLRHRKARTARAFVVCSCFVVLTFGCTGSSNGKGAAPTASGASEAARSGGPQITSLPQVQTTDMTEAEQRLWVELINDQLSPCGDPRSVAKCASEGTKCGACVTAARYLSRMVMEGYDRSTIADHYKTRFGSTKLEISTTDAPVRGAPMAKATIVEFSDFQCPHCGAAHPELVRLLKEFDGNVKLVYRYFPLSNHSRALPAARAAEAARAQGKFWEMHDLLFENQRALEDADLEKYAKQLGLDMEKFKADMNSEATEKRIQADRDMGQKLGIEATPSFFVNGRPLRESLRSLPAYLKEELEL
jgi:protein-disulfide isomerase